MFSNKTTFLKSKKKILKLEETVNEHNEDHERVRKTIIKDFIIIYTLRCMYSKFSTIVFV